MNQPIDFGPLYAETDMSRFPVEPWNTASNLIFLALIIYFGIKTKGNGGKHPLIVTSLPILLIGFIGGTVYHATRSSNLWLYLDFMPILILTVVGSCYFLAELLRSRIRAILAAFLLLAFLRALRGIFEIPHNLSISIGYGMTALLVIVPALLVARAGGWKNVQLVILAILSFGTALSCRILDSTLGQAYLPMGTHFLWHLLGGVAVFCMMEFIFRRDLHGNYSRNLR